MLKQKILNYLINLGYSRESIINRLEMIKIEKKDTTKEMDKIYDKLCKKYQDQELKYKLATIENNGIPPKIEVEKKEEPKDIKEEIKENKEESQKELIKEDITSTTEIKEENKENKEEIQENKNNETEEIKIENKEDNQKPSEENQKVEEEHAENEVNK